MNPDINLYLRNLLLVLLLALQYAKTRIYIHDFLRKTHSKTYIRKHTMGFWNFWTYRQLHREHSMGAAYPLNGLLLASSALFTVAALLTGYSERMWLPLSCMATAAALIGIGCTMYMSSLYFRAEYGRCFVFRKKRRLRRGYDSSLSELLCTLLPVFVIYVFHKY